MFGISVHSLISETKCFTETYICNSQSQSSTFHQKNIYLQKSTPKFNLRQKNMLNLCRNGRSCGIPVCKRTGRSPGSSEEEQVNRIRCQKVSEKVSQEASELVIKVSYKGKRYCQLTQNPSTFKPGTLSLFHRPSYPSTRRCLDTVLQPPHSRRDRHTLK